VDTCSHSCRQLLEQNKDLVPASQHLDDFQEEASHEIISQLFQYGFPNHRCTSPDLQEIQLQSSVIHPGTQVLPPAQLDYRHPEDHGLRKGQWH
jgi:hypothetical protein